MRLTELSVTSWRNLADARIVCDAPLVVVHGDNGHGKSNLLEAVHLLGTLKSFREPRARRWISHGADGARVSGIVHSTMGQRKLDWRWGESGRRLEMDGSISSNLNDWFEVLRAITFCPEDAAIVRGEPERRRRFMDRAAFNAWPKHLSAVTEFRRVLNHKRALLGERYVDPVQLDVFDTAFARTAASVVAGRVKAVQDLRNAFEPMHSAIAGTGKVGIEVKVSGLGSVESMDVTEIEARFRDEIAANRSAELERRSVLVGPHRDDLVLTIDGKLARNFASQGQARSVVLGLKLAELDAAHRRGVVPMFLLDDLTSELDQGRRERLVEVLGTLKGQVWVTTTDAKYLGDLAGSEHLKLRVEQGCMNPE